ncbi:MAG: Uma2 family endonuclease, partial [Dehalococcoidia bacterium]|nr:Uma2 family endonuclease [Dehalococcoidia bacterium]
MTTRAATAIVYPETDGMPLPDGEFQSPLFRRIVGDIEEHFRDTPGAHVNGNTFLYYVEGNPRRSVSPDCYVVFGLSEVALRSLSLEGNNTYLLWEVGKAPDFVLEIGSGSTADADLGRKRDLYANLGVREYWRFDATGGEFYGDPLVGEYLQDGEYHRFELRHESDGRVWSHSDILNLDIWWTDGDLRFWDPLAERWLLRRDEEHAGRLEERAKAELEHAGRLEERARAERERAGRQEAESRVAELEAELRRLR